MPPARDCTSETKSYLSEVASNCRTRHHQPEGQYWLWICSLRQCSPSENTAFDHDSVCPTVPLGLGAT